MEALSSFFSNLLSYIPQILGGILLLIVAWIVASIVRSVARKGLKAANLDEKFVDWGFANDVNSAGNTVDAIAQFLYYLVWILFLSPIFQAFGLTSLAQPISNMINTVLGYIPSIFAAIVIFVIGIFVAKFVYNLIYNFAVGLNLDGWLQNLTSGGSSDSKNRTSTTSTQDASRSSSDSSNSSNVIAKSLGTIGYIVVIVPIVTVALETLGISSISEPIIGLLNSVVAAIPNILVAVILVGVGFFVADIVGNLVGDLLSGAGVNKFSKYLAVDGKTPSVQISSIIAGILKAVIGLFFLVEALGVLNLQVLNTIGSAVIGYLPNVLFAVVVLGLAVVGGQMLGNFLSETLGSKWLGTLVKFSLIILGVFMAFSELNIASEIVNTAFIFIVGAVSVAFAIAFGVGGRDFAKRQLEKLDKKIDNEADTISKEAKSQDNSSNVNIKDNNDSIIDNLK